jgi:hypothetical protein
MKKILILFLAFSTVLFAQTEKKNDISSQARSLAIAGVSNTKAILVIDPKFRAQDIIGAYNDIKKDSSSKIVFYLNNNKIISNVIDISNTPNSTVLIFKTTTNIGIKQEAVFLEDILSISTL